MNCQTLPRDKELEKMNKLIDQQIKKTKRDFLSEIKLLLLGTGESGKSTIAKQMKVIHAGGFSDAELKSYTGAATSNSIQSMEALVRYCNRKGLTPSEANKDRFQKFSARETLPTKLTKETANDIKLLWADEAIQTAFNHRSEFQIPDSSKYCFENVDRFSEPNYFPTTEDVIHFRVRTTGITETKFRISASTFNMVDVGGQRSERRKWIHCFEGVTALIYVAALSEYDMKLYEDETVNRLDEALELFEEIVNSKWFSRTPIILFLNKSDLFREKLEKQNLSDFFPQYDGGADFDKGVQFIQKLFLAKNKNTEKMLFSHVTMATDTQNVKRVFNNCRTIILGNNLSTAFM